MSHSPQNFSRQEPIPGYTTTELIGRGGFGEVWKAVAPGGVSKAIKLVLGDDPSRAESELRSLNRIKDVRHPLILSIDRIEVVHGTLVIVTELGDCNLKEYGQRFRSQGQVGIPQAEMLPMIRDAAEALDYIYTEHSLQHLDVKPENFLVFGKHLKIADFGVVKHIYERSASLVHGLTPVYAAPELFEGKANRHTDQYSLAIVYQEMLTGQLPFDGISPARLATQHLIEPPNLQALPERQQPVIARALSKDPHQRFNNCVELVKELEKATRKTTPPVEEISESSPPTTANKTVVLPSEKNREEAPATSSENIRSAESKGGPQPSIDPRVNAILEDIEHETQGLRPTIFVGIGGTAAQVLQRLRSRINERLGHLRDVPAIKLLLIDSDVQQLNQINRDEDVWKEIETVAVPLRKSDEYRSQHGRLKGWINRRWLYNIPRDQSTEGIRPLGRLALVTNFQRVMSAIDRSIKHCTTKESSDQSSQTLEVPFQPGPPRIVLVTSLSGGTGSGMMFDVAYALRNQLTQAGYDKDDVDAILLHSTPRKGRDKAIANAYAALQELDHFSQRGNYFPGDSHMGISAFHGNNRTFNELEFLHLGDNLEQQQWTDASDDVAEYLFCRLIDKNRISPPVPASGDMIGRSVAIQQLGAANRLFLKEFSAQVCLEMLDCWRGRELQDRNTVSFTQPTTFLNQLITNNAAKHRQLSEELSQKVDTLELNVEFLLKYTRNLAQQELGKPPEQYLESMIRETLTLEPDPGMTPTESAVSVLEKMLSAQDPEEVEAEGPNTLFAMLLGRSETYANKLSAELRAWLQDLVNDPQSRVDGAHYAAEQAHSVIQDLISATAREKARVREKIDSLKLRLTTGPEQYEKRRSWMPFRSQRAGKLEEALLEYGNTKLEGILLAVVHKQFRTIEAQVGVMIDQTQRLSHDLTRLSNKFETSRPTDSVKLSSQWFDESTAWYVQGVRERLLKKRVELTKALESAIETTLADSGHTLQRFLDPRIELSEVLLVPMREHSRDVVSRAVASIHCELVDDVPEGTETEDHVFPLPQLIQKLIQNVWEDSSQERDRISIVIPKSADGPKLKKQLQEIGQPLSVVNLVTNGITLFRRIEKVTLSDFLQSLTGGADVYADLAKRLHSRDDVDWKPVTEASAGTDTGNLAKLSEGVNVDQTAMLNH